MQSTQNIFLKIIPSAQMESWSVQSLVGSIVSYNQKFPLVKIGDFLVQNRETISIKNDEEYKRITVRIKNGGVILRDIEKGINIGTKKQFLARSGQFIVSKIDARNGAFGIVPNELQGAIVTNDFPLFEADKSKIMLDFLVLITTTKEFLRFAQSCSSGTTNRQRMDVDLFLKQKIPLPSIPEQLILMASYNNKKALIEKLEKKAKILENEISEYFLSKLGIEKKKDDEIKKGLQLYDFKNIERWDVWTNKNTVIEGSYKIIKFGEIVIGKPMYGANVKGVKKISDTRYIRITDINENGQLNEEFCSPEFVEEKYLLKENDFLIARSGNTVGKTFLYKKKYGRAIYAGYLVKYLIDYSKVIPEYLSAYTKSYTFKKWIESNQRIAGQPNINGQEFLQAPFILPPTETQQKIIERVEKIKNEIDKLLSERDRINFNTRLEFENEIFA